MKESKQCGNCVGIFSFLSETSTVLCVVLCCRGGVDGKEWPACSPDLNLNEHSWDQLGSAAIVTNTTRLCVTKLVTSMRRRCQAAVVVYGPSTCYLPVCLLSLDFNHPIH
uniref:Uncharacterized protein n=1 Tax=Maylandia zebra TaxID=106582 RepID=A0A3P9AUL9_9CICH